MAGVESPVPENASSHGCGWPAVLTLPIPDNWRSGYYHVRFKAEDGGGKFVQRGGGRPRRLLLHRACGDARPELEDPAPTLHEHVQRLQQLGRLQPVCVQRPSRPCRGIASRSCVRRPASSSNWEQPFVAWAEANGYTFDYAANSDLEFHPEEIQAYKLVLSVGHDEYWSAPMRDNLEAFIRNGGNVAFFSGNTCCWQVRSEDEGSALVSWKQRFVMDPVYPSGDHRLLSTLWSHHLVNRPENQLTGVGFLLGGYHRSHGQFMDGRGAYTVHRPDHWLFAGTGLKRGDEFGGKDTIVGYECDGCEIEVQDGLPVPTHRDGTPDTS